MEKRFSKEPLGIRIDIGPLLTGVSGLIKLFIAFISEFCRTSRICHKVSIPSSVVSGQSSVVSSQELVVNSQSLVVSS